MNQTINKGLASTMGLLAFTSCGQKQEKVVEEQPNIIVIYTDDLGYGDMSCQNPNSKIPTKNLDQLAAQGIRFTDGHSSCSISTPSRFSILTGTYHWRHINMLAGNFTRTVFQEDEFTLATMLKECGYSTAAIGKWHLGWDWDSVLNPGAEMIKGEDGWGNYYGIDMIDWTKPIKGGPMAFGFDYYYGNDCPFHPPYTMIEYETVLKAPTEIFLHRNFKVKEGDSEMRNGPMADDWNPYDLVPNLTNKVVELIKNKDENKPLFVYYGIPAPHTPILPNDEFDNTSDAGPYGDYVVELDDHVGKIMNALKEKGIDKNTIIVFTSDNGPEVYAVERFENYAHNSSTLRGVKRDSYEGGHRVPFIISWPEKIKGGQVSNQVISQVDLMATFAAVAGYELPNNKAVDSYNLLPVLTGENIEGQFREATIFNCVRGIYAIRKGDWLYINNYNGSHNGKMKGRESYFVNFDFEQYSKEENPGLLFNLKTDIMQKHNVYDEYPEVVKDLAATLKDYQDQGRSIPERVVANK